MKEAQDLIPWKVTDISIRPYDGFWSMNPSIHFDGELWRCVLRCCDYAMPNGVTIRSPKAGPGHQTKNAMGILDPATWKPIKIFKMHERDGLQRSPCANVGYEDMRIFKTDRGGLQGIAASLHLERERKTVVEGSPQHQPPEQVLLSFDPEYNIIGARPIRGDWWSGTPQKNWVPFDRCAEPRFLYSIDRGTLFDAQGALHGDAARVQPSSAAPPVPSSLVIAQDPSSEVAQEQERRARALAEEREHEQAQAREHEAQAREHERSERARREKEDRHASRRAVIRSADTQMVRGRTVKADTLVARPSARPATLGVSSAGTTRHGTRGQAESTRVLGTGRVLLPKYEGLRGGSQLVHVGVDAWLGIAHEMKFVQSKKYYWHTFYLVDSKGKMTAASPPCKLASEGIEFAAGVAIDGNKLVVSFGVDDMHCRVGETQLSAVLGMLHPVAKD